MNLMQFATGQISCVLAELLITLILFKQLKPQGGRVYLYLPYFIFLILQYICSYLFFKHGINDVSQTHIDMLAWLCKLLCVFFCFKGKPISNIFRYLLYCFAPYFSAIILSGILIIFHRDDSLLSVCSADELYLWVFLTFLHLSIVFITLLLMRRFANQVTTSPGATLISLTIMIALDILAFLLAPYVPELRRLYLRNPTPLFTYFISAIFISIIIISATVFKSMYDHERACRVSQYNDFLQRQMQLQYQSFLETERARDDLHKLKHDIANHILMLQSMIAENSAEQKEYVNSLSEQFAVAGKVVICPNHILNSILSRTTELCDELGIECSFQVNLPAQLEIKDVDLMCVFSNLLSNAVQACELVPSGKRFIRFAVVLRAGAVAAFMENSCTKQSIDGFSDAAKHDKLEHGWGTRIIKDVSEKYDGSFSIKFQKSKAICKVLMMNKAI